MADSFIEINQYRRVNSSDGTSKIVYTGKPVLVNIQQVEFITQSGTIAELGPESEPVALADPGPLQGAEPIPADPTAFTLVFSSGKTLIADTYGLKAVTSGGPVPA